MPKNICLSLPQKCIEMMDAIVYEQGFASRSDFVRHCIRQNSSADGLSIQRPEPRSEDFELGVSKEAIEEFFPS